MDFLAFLTQGLIWYLFIIFAVAVIKAQPPVSKKEEQDVQDK